MAAVFSLTANLRVWLGLAPGGTQITVCAYFKQHLIQAHTI